MSFIHMSPTLSTVEANNLWIVHFDIQYDLYTNASGADRENRTPISSLARTCPTTKRYPHIKQTHYSIKTYIVTNKLCSFNKC